MFLNKMKCITKYFIHTVYFLKTVSLRWLQSFCIQCCTLECKFPISLCVTFIRDNLYEQNRIIILTELINFSFSCLMVHKHRPVQVFWVSVLYLISKFSGPPLKWAPWPRPMSPPPVRWHWWQIDTNLLSRFIYSNTTFVWWWIKCSKENQIWNRKLQIQK
jgi:hypothetical protein